MHELGGILNRPPCPHTDYRNPPLQRVRALVNMGWGVSVLWRVPRDRVEESPLSMETLVAWEFHQQPLRLQVV